MTNSNINRASASYNGRAIGSTTKAGQVQYGTAAQVAAGTRADRAVSCAALSTELERRAELPGAVQYAEVTISSAEMLALRATPKTLVAAPGAGKVIEFLGAVLLLDYNSAAYVETSDNMAIKFENGSGVAVSDAIEATGFVTATADTMTNAVPVKDAIVAKTGCENKALVLHNTGDGEYTTGDSPVRVKVMYVVHQTGF